MLGDKIKKLREDKRMTQQELADSIGIAQSTIGMIEKGRTCGRKTLVKLADFFGVTVDYLLSDDEEMDKIAEYESQNKIFFSKFGKLSEKDRNKIIKMIEIFEDETEN
ncbi:TPA: helix-turn-helix transcriptional regulator [Escherichia coli]|nr:helix-turn-helix transcriptional regulator [Escherichia coli]HAY3976996.1 helix-turn-helix transcriptional regulator [Escherichia coli]